MKNRDHSISIIKNGLLKGISIGTGIGIGLITTTLFATAAAMKIFSAGEVISADQLNRNFTIAGPVGEISAFYLPDCPDGWAVADGTNGTPDLRGRFIRGMDNMGVGAANVDPQSALRTLGHEQMDAFQGHWHSFHYLNQTQYFFQGVNNGASASNEPALHNAALNNIVRDASTDGAHGPVRLSTETRPRNVALIYCMRKN